MRIQSSLQCEWALKGNVQHEVCFWSYSTTSMLINKCQLLPSLEHPSKRNHLNTIWLKYWPLQFFYFRDLFMIYGITIIYKILVSKMCPILQNVSYIVISIIQNVAKAFANKLGEKKFFHTEIFFDNHKCELRWYKFSGHKADKLYTCKTRHKVVM